MTRAKEKPKYTTVCKYNQQEQFITVWTDKFWFSSITVGDLLSGDYNSIKEINLYNMSYTGRAGTKADK